MSEIETHELGPWIGAEDFDCRSERATYGNRSGPYSVRKGRCFADRLATLCVGNRICEVVASFFDSYTFNTSRSLKALAREGKRNIREPWKGAVKPEELYTDDIYSSTGDINLSEKPCFEYHVFCSSGGYW